MEKLLSNLDRVIKLTVPANIVDSKDDHKKLVVLESISRFFHKISICFQRILNVIFGDHEWYDEGKARKIVKYYLWHAKPAEKTNERTQKIAALYDNLAHISRGKSHWAQRLERGWIEDLASEEATDSFVRMKNQPAISDRQLFHIHADEFGKNSRLEGDGYAASLMVISAYMSSRKKHPECSDSIPQDLLNQVQNAAMLAEASNFVACAKEQLQQAIAANKPMLIASGWQGKPGHAMCYEIIPAEAGKAVLRIYNTGGGVDRHHAAFIGNKKKYQTYTEWRGIDSSRLLDSSFWTVLQELNGDRVADRWFKDNNEYGEDDVYTGLKNLLQPTHIEAQFPIDQAAIQHEFMSPQRAGVCSERSLMAFLRTRMGYAEYKRFRCCLKIQTLVDKVRSVKNKTPLGHDLLTYLPKAVAAVIRDLFKINVTNPKITGRLIEKSRNKLAISIERLYRNNIVGKKFLTSAQVALAKLDGYVEETKKSRLKAKLRSNALRCTKPTEEVDQACFPRPKETLLAQSQKAFTPLQHYGFLCEAIKKSGDTSPANIAASIEKIRAIAEGGWQSGEDVAVYSGLISWIATLPIDAAFWHRDSSSAKNMIADLGRIGHVLFKTCFMVPHAEGINPDRIHAMMKLQWIQCALTASIDRGFHHDVGVSFDTHRLQSLFFSQPDATLRAEFEEMVKLSHKRTLFNNHYQYDSAEKALYGYHSANDEMCKLIKKMMVLAPGIEEKLETDIANWNQLSETQKEAYIYTSSALPQWMQAIRDNNVHLKYLCSAPVAHPGVLDRKSAFTLKSKVVEMQQGEAAVYFETTGITSEIYNNSVVKELQNATDTRFQPNFRTIISPQIRAFVSYLRTKMQYGYQEKELLSDYVKNHSIAMPDEEFKELAHLFLHGSIRHLEALAYFTKHPQKLKDPDYQILFSLLMFKPTVYESNLKNPGFEAILQKFLNGHIERMLGENEIQAAVFLLQKMREFQTLFPNVPALQNSLSTLRNMLKRPGLEPHEKSVIYAELIVHLGKKDELTELEVAELITAHAYKTDIALPTRWQDPQIENEGIKAVHKHATAMYRYLIQGGKTDEFLNGLLQLLRPHAPLGQWKITQQQGDLAQFATADNKVLFDPLQGKLVAFEHEAYLPLDIQEHPHFKTIFGGVQKAIAKPGFVYQFTSRQGKNVLVQKVGDELVIEQQMSDAQDGWHRFIPDKAFLITKKHKHSPDTYRSSFTSRQLVNDYSHWQSIEEPEKIVCLSRKTGQVEYQAKYSGGKMKEVRRLSDGAILGKPADLFKDFEDKGYVEFWYDGKGRQKEIALTRYSLTFTPGSNKQLMCREYPGYFLCKEQSCGELRPYKHYLLLQNQAGHKKVLMPVHQYLMLYQKHESLLPEYAIEQELHEADRNPQRFVSFDLKANGRLDSKSLEANLYLAESLTLVQEYAKAAFYLKKYGSKLTQYSDKERFIIQKLLQISAVTGDSDGDSASLKTYAAYLLLKNSQDHGFTLSEGDSKAVLVAYSEYLNHYQKAQALRLDKQEELFLLTFLLQNSRSHLFCQRYKELTGVVIEPDEKQAPAALQPECRSVSGVLDRLSYTLSAKLTPDVFKNMLITRPMKVFDQYLYDIFLMAKDGSIEDKKRIRESCSFLGLERKDDVNGERNKEQAIALFLSTVLDNPGAFSASPERKICDESIQWAGLSVKTANKIIERQRPPLAPVVIPKRLANLTPAGFCLDQKAPALPKITLSFECPAHDTLEGATRAAQAFERVQHSPGNIPQHGLGDLLSTLSSDDAVEQKEIKRLQLDHEVFCRREKGPVYTLSQEGKSRVEAILKAGAEENKALLERLELEIVALANRAPAFSLEKAKEQLLKWGGVRKDITIDDAIIAFARKDTHVLRAKNPSLDENDFNALYTKVGHYLQVATFEQQRARSSRLLEKLAELQKRQQKDPQDEHDVVQLLAESMLAKRTFEPASNTAYLVFEYYADILLRPIQKEKLEAFLDGTNPNLIMEMIMGSGKSKVLLPLLGLLRADGKTLSLLIVPQPLFESISTDTQGILREAFGQSLRSLHFDRNSVMTPQSLKAHLADLETIQKNRECLIMTSKSVQCLILKLIEESERYYKSGAAFEQKPVPEELVLLQKMVLILSVSGYPIIDEADSILNVLHEVCFSLGMRQNPKGDEILLISELYELLLNDPNMKKLGGLECDPTKDVSAPTVTEEVYATTMKRPLAAAFMARLKSIKFENAERTAMVNRWAEGLSLQQQGLLLDYLCRDGDIGGAQGFFSRQREEIQDILALASEEISSLLKHTLTRNSNEKYGLDDDVSGLFAIPFAAANTPNHGSQFANAYVTMNYTFQTYIKRGVTRVHLTRAIEKLQQNALKEMRDGSIPLHDTQSWQLFCKLKGSLDVPLFNYKEAHLEALDKKINASLATKCEFVKNIILPQLDLFDGKLSCNPHNLVAFFKSVLGFTGTLWNGASMHRKLQPEPEAGTDAKTLGLLWDKSRTSVFSLHQTSMEGMLQEMASFGAFDMISDAGGYFKEGGNKVIASMMSDRLQKPVVFYNQKGEQVVTSGNKEVALNMSSLSEDERLTFLDQSHTTGADVKQKRSAVAYVTIGRNMLLRDLLQSSWRLRGLDKSQRVQFVVSQEVESIIRQELKKSQDHKISFDDILSFVIRNQARQQGRDNFKAFTQELWNIPQQLLFRQLLSSALDAEQTAQAFALLRKTWIKPVCRPARELYGHIATERPSGEIVAEEVERCETFLREIFSKVRGLQGLDGCLQEIQEVKQHMQNSLPKNVLSKGEQDSGDSDQTVEIEQQTHTETELEEQEQSQLEKVSLGLIWNRGWHEKVPSPSDALFVPNARVQSFDLARYMEQDAALKEWACAFEGINITTNVLEFSKDNTKLSACKLLGSHRTPFHFVAIADDEVTILSQQESLYPINGFMYNLTLGFCKEPQPLHPEAEKKLVKIKFLDGESHFTKREIDMLREWFIAVGARKMKTLYVEHIVSGYPLKAIAYNQSPLQKLFGELCK